MKKLFNIVLSVIFVFSACITVSAGQSNTTQVVYTGEGTEEFVVTVPAKLEPGEQAEVSVSGTWAGNRLVTVEADSTVVLTNSLDETQTKELEIYFEGISVLGNNLEEVEATDEGCTVEISVEDISNALFGTWSGAFHYTVGISDSEMPLMTMTMPPQLEEPKEEVPEEEPIIEEPIIEEPIIEEPIIEEPIVEEPIIEEPIIEEPIIEEPIIEEPIVEEQIVEESIIEKPIEEPIEEEPIIEDLTE